MAGVSEREPRWEPSEPPPPAARSWFGTGVLMMTLPMALGMTLMLAPVAWVLGVRSRR